MKTPKPRRLNFTPSPKIHIPEKAEPEVDSEDDTFEIKNPILANLFHYGMVGIILVIIFIFAGSLLFGKSGGSIPAFLIGGILSVIGIIRWIRSNDYDKGDSGF